MSALLKSPLVASMLKSLIPMLFKQIADLPLSAKHQYAAVLADTCDAYIEGDRVGFEALLTEAGFDDTLKEALNNALWSEDKGE